MGPHPSREGRGTFAGCFVWLRARWVAEGDGGGEGMSEERTKTKCDGTDVRFKLHSPSKIIFDIASY